MRLLTTIFLWLAPLIGFASAQDAPSLASLKDKNRVLIVFAPSERSPEFRRQFEVLSRHAYDMRERDLVLLPVVTVADGPATAGTLRVSHSPVASDAEAIALRQRFHIGPGQFTVILIGKDGGEKLRRKTAVSMDELNATIDAMPMRQDEIRQRK